MGRTDWFVRGLLPALAVSLLLSACGGGDAALNPGRSVAGFTLGVLGDTLVDGAGADGFNLAVREDGAEVLVDVNVTGAEGLKALYFTLDYDETSYAPLAVEVTDALGDEAALLSLDILDQPGEVHSGRVLTHFTDRPGYSGDGVLATVRFSREPRNVWRTAQSVPMTDKSQPELVADSGEGYLIWRFMNLGDYNMDKLVGVSDLTPLGQNYDAQSPDFPDPWPVNHALNAVDGTGDGMITLNDITPIGQNYGRLVSAYNVYQGELADLPTEAADGNGDAVLAGTVAFEDRSTMTGERPYFTYTPDSPGTSYFWVRPTDGSDEGIPSNAVQFTLPGSGTLSVTDPPLNGEGTEQEPYIVENDDYYHLSFVHPVDGDVTNDVNTEYTISDPEAGVVTTASGALAVDDDFTGGFTVSATYNDIAAENTLYFSVGMPAVLTFTNMPDEGAGTIDDPLIVNVDTTWVFSLYHLLDGEVCGSTDTVWTVSEPAAGSVSAGPSQATLNIEDDYYGTFSVGATYRDVPSMPALLYLRVPGSDATALTLVNTPALGDGSVFDPFVVNTDTDYQFSVVHPMNGEVSTDALTVFTVSDGAAGSIATETNTLNIEDAFLGDFYVAAAYNGEVSLPAAIYFTVPEVNPTDPPEAAITADPQTSDVTPVEVTLDATGSTDSDGTIASYAWDYEGDGEYDVTGATEPTIDHMYAGTGQFNATVLVTDNDGATDTASVTVTITDEGNYWPTCVLTADTSGGEVPVTVNFDASGSSDPETAALHYWWDLDGDGDFETDGGTTATINHEYTDPAHIWPAVKVYDEADAWDYDEWELTLTSGGNLPPTAMIDADKQYLNPPPDTVNFTAADSLDEDGTIVSYRWDFDGDGEWDAGPAASPTTSHEYTVAGNYDVVVEVTDDDGATDTAAMRITVNDGSASWHLYEVFTPDGTEVISAGDFSSLKLVDGYPAIAFQATYNGTEYTKKKAMYVRATEADGNAWGTPVVVDDPYWEQESSGIEVDLEIVDGNPAICFARREWISSAWRYGLYYARSVDTAGADWSDGTVDVDSPSDDARGTHCDMAVCGGYPMISYFAPWDQTLYFTAATAADGSAWGTPVLLDDNGGVASAYSSGEFNSICAVDGFPAVSYLTRVSDISAGYHLRFIRAADANGGVWGTPVSLDVEQNVAQGTCLGLLGNGNPAIAYCGADDDHNYIYWLAATAADGSAWGSRVTAESTTSGYDMTESPSWITYGGLPAIASKVNGFMDGTLYFSLATDATGSGWEGAQEVCTPGSGIEVSCRLINGMPAISYQVESSEALYFAIYY